jgi:hypothetical protein
MLPVRSHRLCIATEHSVHFETLAGEIASSADKSVPIGLLSGFCASGRVPRQSTGR